MAPRFGQSEALLVGVVSLVAVQRWVVPLVSSPALRSWGTMFVAVVVQAIPFLVLGVLLSATVSTLLSERVLRRLVPSRPAVAVPVAGISAIGLIGCECASVPLASGVMRRGVPPAAALTFMLAAPAVNPVVLVSTAVAFPRHPEMVVGRFAASLVTAVVVGWLWLLLGRSFPPLPRTVRHEHGPGWLRFLAAAQHDFLQTAGFLVLGGMAAATVNTLVPRSVLDRIGVHPVGAVLVLALAAFLVALCSQTDAFVAASLLSFSLTARLVFLVVGPAMDVKLAVLDAGVFGRRFAAVFVPVVMVVALASALLVARVLL